MLQPGRTLAFCASQFIFQVRRHAYQIPSDSVLWRQFEYVSKTVPSHDGFYRPNTNRQLGDLLQTLDRLLENGDMDNLKSSTAYLTAMRKFPVLLDRCFADKDQLIKVLFYVGLQKSKHVQGLTNNVLNKLQKNFDHLILEDVCIMATTVFKCSVDKINASTVKLIASTVQNHFQQLLDSPSELVCLIKTLRQQRHHDLELLRKLDDSSAVWLKNPVIIKGHILSYFAEAHFCPNNDKNILTDIFKECRNGSQFRDKDLARLLWTASILGTDFNKRDVNVIWSLISTKTEQYKKKPELFLDCLLSMAIMGHHDLIFSEQLLTRGTIYKFLNSTKSMPVVRLKKFVTILKIEQGAEVNIEIPDINEPFAEQQVRDRPALKRILFALKCLSQKLNLTSVQCTFCIPSIYDAGIEVHSKQKCIHIVVLDSTAYLRDSKKPTGLTKLKLRLLNRLGLEFIVVEQEDLDLTDDALNSKLELKLRAIFTDN